MPGHGGIRTYDLRNTSPMLFHGQLRKSYQKGSYGQLQRGGGGGGVVLLKCRKEFNGRMRKDGEVLHAYTSMKNGNKLGIQG